jgi:hypothetical protein
MESPAHKPPTSPPSVPTSPSAKPTPAPTPPAPALHPDDQAVLDRFKAEEKARQEQIAACKEAKQAEDIRLKQEQQRLNQEAAQIAKDDAAMKKERADIKADEKSAKTDEEKAALQKSKDELAKKQTALDDAKKKNKEGKGSAQRKLTENVKKKCPAALPQGRHCVPPDPKKKMTDPLAGIADNFNKVNGTKVDFAQLVKQEAAYTGAYVPWWPIPKGKTSVTLTQRYPRTDDTNKPVIQGDSHSGTSIGVGVDLGPQNKEAYFRELDAANKKYGVLTDAELAAMKKTVDPYMGKMRAEACAYLAAHPLELTDKELQLLHTRALDEAYRVINPVRTGFTQKNAAEQTSIFKQKYNRGGG